MVDGLDSWQAMELDVALAVKHSTLEKEDSINYLEAIMSGIDNLIRVQGQKVPKRNPRKSIIGKYRESGKETDGLPLVDDVLKQLTGGNTVVNIGELL